MTEAASPSSTQYRRNIALSSSVHLITPMAALVSR
jgi:hypothetical protein